MPGVFVVLSSPVPGSTMHEETLPVVYLVPGIRTIYKYSSSVLIGLRVSYVN